MMTCSRLSIAIKTVYVMVPLETSWLDIHSLMFSCYTCYPPMLWPLLSRIQDLVLLLTKAINNMVVVRKSLFGWVIWQTSYTSGDCQFLYQQNFSLKLTWILHIAWSILLLLLPPFLYSFLVILHQYIILEFPKYYCPHNCCLFLCINLIH